jgi:hypothetical protein
VGFNRKRADMKTATAVLDEVTIIKEFKKSTDTKENS